MLFNRLSEDLFKPLTDYKSPDLKTVRIKSEHPLEAAKRALTAINPERQGIESFQVPAAAE